MAKKFIKNRRWVALRSLTSASVKMYFRNKSAVFFTLFMPLIFISVFGFLSKSGATPIKLDLVNNSHTQLAASFVKSLRSVDAFKISEVSDSTGSNDLKKGTIDLKVVIPADFGQTDAVGKLQESNLQTYFNKSKPGNGQTANLILNQIAASVNAGIGHTPQIVAVKSTGVSTNNLGYIDFILPGILAMTIMQLGLFSVAFAFVSMKTTGALRRLQATPTHPLNFIVAQSITRLLIGMLQVVILAGLGVAYFSFHMIGSFIDFAIMAMLGTVVFLAFGFSIAGYAKDENSAAPLANLVSLPMLFLSGIFFPRDGFPVWLKDITNYFPLTYLADGLRQIANDGVTLIHLGGDILGLVVWGIVMFFVAIKLFRWE